ncbi:MAG: polyprenyl synthetase family protein [Bacteroidetes bacterium]|nr:polyprenyl synthetase family protein [Bacteroidota bacterium]
MYNKIKEYIADDLELFEKELNSLLQSEMYLLNVVLNYVNSNCGKRLRPIMMMLISKLFTHSEHIYYEKLIDFAVAVETLHQATLIHDDVVDDSKERRSKASVNSIYDNKISVLLGDYMFSVAFNCMYKHRNFDIMDAAAHTLKTMSEGELFALELSNNLLHTEETYYKVIYSKTASLIEFSCKIPALIYSDSIELVEVLSEYGKNIGIAFQMRDDLFDYTDDNKLIGKPVGNDIKEHQITLPLIYALNHCSATERERILSILKLAIISDAQVKDIISFTKVMGGLEYAEKKAKDFVNRAISCLDIFPDGLEKDMLIYAAHYMIDRTK